MDDVKKTSRLLFSCLEGRRRCPGWDGEETMNSGLRECAGAERVRHLYTAEGASSTSRWRKEQKFPGLQSDASTVEPPEKLIPARHWRRKGSLNDACDTDDRADPYTPAHHRHSHTRSVERSKHSDPRFTKVNPRWVKIPGVDEATASESGGPFSSTTTAMQPQTPDRSRSARGRVTPPPAVFQHGEGEDTDVPISSRLTVPHTNSSEGGVRSINFPEVSVASDSHHPEQITFSTKVFEMDSLTPVKSMDKRLPFDDKQSMKVKTSENIASEEHPLSSLAPFSSIDVTQGGGGYHSAFNKSMISNSVIFPPHNPPSALLQTIVNNVASSRDVEPPSIPPEVIVAFDEYIGDGTTMLHFPLHSSPKKVFFAVKFINLYEVNDELLPEVVFGWKSSRLSSKMEHYFLLSNLVEVSARTRDHPAIRHLRESAGYLSYSTFLKKKVIKDECLFRLTFRPLEGDGPDEDVIAKAPNLILYYSWLVFSDYISSIGEDFLNM